jgi:hypothetical protein
MTIENTVAQLKRLAADAEDKVNGVQDGLVLAAADLARLVGPLAAGHLLAEQALEYFALAKKVGER